MKAYCLDTSALLALRDDEPGAERVAELLVQAQSDRIRCVACFMTRMEVLYRVWKDEDESAAHLAFEQDSAPPLANLLVSYLQHLNLEVDEFSTGSSTLNGLRLSS